MKIKSNSDNTLCLKNMLELHTMVADVRSVFHEGRKITPKFSYTNACTNYKCHILLELLFLKVLMLTRKGYQKGVLFIIIFLDKGIKLKPETYNGCHNALMMFANFDNMAIYIYKAII